MPIVRRTPATDSLQAPTSMAPKREFIPDPRAIVSHVEPKLRRAAAIVEYDERDPKTIPVEDLVALARTCNSKENMEVVYRNRIRNRNTAIRAFCVMCIGGPKKVRACADVDCPIWPFRLGNNPFRRRAK